MWDAVPLSSVAWGIHSNAPDVRAYLDVNGSMEEVLPAAAFHRVSSTGV